MKDALDADGIWDAIRSAGLDLPDWLAALEEEVSMVRCRRRHQSSDDAPRRIEQIRLSWEEWQRQIADDAA